MKLKYRSGPALARPDSPGLLGCSPMTTNIQRVLGQGGQP